MNLLGVDVGTTHCKAGVFGVDRSVVRIATRPMRVQRWEHKAQVFDPDELWATVVAVIEEATATVDPGSIAAVGVASMAETGLLIDRRTGEARSPFIPWFDTCAAKQAQVIANASDPRERFCRSGVHPTFKISLAKLLWLREQAQIGTRGAVWLSVADYVVYRLSGALATDPTLAVRTYAFRLDHKTWDDEWMRQFGFAPDLFPPAYASGTPVGKVRPELAEQVGLAAGTPVAVAGHDHVCAALAVGATEPGLVFDSMGTAEALVGALEERPLGEAEFRSGLAYGPHVVAGRSFWMGGLSTSGGSVEWLRSILSPQPLSYGELQTLLATASDYPTGILYFPYLLGSGSPHSDPLAQGAFVGLQAQHSRADLLKAVLEGTAFEVEYIRRSAEQATGVPIKTIVAVGGGTNNKSWMQIKADVSGCCFHVPPVGEATLLGAALVAGLGCGLYQDQADLFAAIHRQVTETWRPNQERHQQYQRLYEHGYLPLQRPLREYYRKLELGSSSGQT